MNYAYRVEPGEKVNLEQIATRAPKDLERQQGEATFAELAEQIGEIQEELYAAAEHSVLLILQGTDTSGKDGAIRKVLGKVSPNGLRVESFKAPTEEELAHDFLWRVHRVVPRRGMFGVFNRSHYEDVLVARVYKLVSEAVWTKRYEQINEFEQLLAENNTIIIKCFLHISKDEQEQRLLAREQDVEKAWKLAAGDWKDRKRWDDFAATYEDALAHCSTNEAPWYIIPADQKWFRNLAIAQVVVDQLKNYRSVWQQTLQDMSKERMAELAAYRAEQKSE